MSVLVSTIIPFLDQEPFLAEAIDSVRTQTIPEWEILLIDDGSRDSSADIAAAYAATDPERIKLLRHPDGRTHGAAASRNLGVAAASGKYITFLDADDVYERDKMETEIALLEASPEAAMLYAPTRWWYPGTETPLRTEKPGVETGRIHQPPSLLIRLLLLHKGNVPCTCAVLIRRDALLSVGGFEEAFHLYEDQTLWAKLFLRYPVLVAARPTSRYRQHPASASAAAQRAGQYHPWRMHPAEKRFFEWLEHHVASNRPEDPLLARELERSLAPYRRRSAAGKRWARDLSRLARSHTRRLVRRFGRKLVRR